MEHAGGPEKLDRVPAREIAEGHDWSPGEKIAGVQGSGCGGSWAALPTSSHLSATSDACDPDWRVFLGIEGFPVGVKNPLPRTRDVFEPQTKWKLEMGPLDVAQSWKANYESAEENLSFVREHFDTEVAEGLMAVMSEKDFWARYGKEAAISAIAVIVEEGPPMKRRVVHDASHDVLLNHRIRCLDKVRAPVAREKRLILRRLKAGKDGAGGGDG